MPAISCTKGISIHNRRNPRLNRRSYPTMVVTAMKRLNFGSCPQTAAADADYGENGGGRPSVTILSLSSDRGALALGPQLAAFAASQGIPTVLFLGPQQDPDATATLRIACADAARSNRSGLLEAIVSEHASEPPDIALTVVILAVDGRTPRIPDTMQTTTTLLGVSSGAATAEQLARVAVSADTEGREITGILVADPEPGDPTTGRIPQLSRPAHRRLPTRQKGYERR